MADKTQREIYEELYTVHVFAGDDRLNATQRIIDAGCPPDLAHEIAAEYDDEDDPEE